MSDLSTYTVDGERVAARSLTQAKLSAKAIKRARAQSRRDNAALRLMLWAQSNMSSGL